MGKILTLVSSNKNNPLTQNHFDQAVKILQTKGIDLEGDLNWLCNNGDKAANIKLSGEVPRDSVDRLMELFETDKIDFFITDEDLKIELVLSDMDATIVTSETLDELADYAGIKEQIAEITKRAMNGELDFHEAVRERVGLLKGLSTEALAETLKSIQLTKGAETFIKTMKERGATCVLVSGGFTYFTGAIAEKCGFDHHHGNTLGIDEKRGELTGTVIPPILDKHSKVEFLEQHMTKLGLNNTSCLTIGDGANDLPMLQQAGLGIGFEPKDKVKATIDNCIIHGDLTTALFAQGIMEKDFYCKPNPKAENISTPEP